MLCFYLSIVFGKSGRGLSAITNGRMMKGFRMYEIVIVWLDVDFCHLCFRILKFKSINVVFRVFNFFY